MNNRKSDNGKQLFYVLLLIGRLQFTIYTYNM